MQVYLIWGEEENSDEVYLGTVDEILGPADRESSYHDTWLRTALSDIVANLLSDPTETCALFAIEIR